MKELSILVNNISKNFNSQQALDDISISIKKKELFGFIGPDGAGKTTLFRILTTLLKPNNGTATVEGFDVVKNYKEIRKISGYMPGRFSLYFDLTVEENLNFYASIFKTSVEENYHLIKDVYQQIEPYKKRLARNLSGGMKQKLALSCALIHQPKVLFLDEPTTGVDAVSRKEFWEMLKSLKEKGITILVSTPYMDEAVLCDRVALMQKGKILSVDTPQNIIDSFEKPVLSIKTNRMYELIYDLRDLKNTLSAFRFGQCVHYCSILPEHDIKEITEYLKSKGHKNIEIEKIEPDIEDCFMDMM